MSGSGGRLTDLNRPTIRAEKTKVEKLSTSQGCIMSPLLDPIALDGSFALS